jgi:hypothetical protein
MRKLNLSKETLAELSTDDLTLVVGGQATLAVACFVTNPCITTPVTGLRCYLTGSACA